MKIIKRNGVEVVFDLKKIVTAVSKANAEVPLSDQLSEEQINQIAKNIETACAAENHQMNVEAIQDMVEKEIMKAGAFDIAKKYITYRYQHELMRKANTTDKQIMSLLECQNEEVKQENSNKNSTVVSVQRDYMAGEVSKDITKRFLLDEDIVQAHNEGIIHFHDADYFAQHMHNCDLVNLEDMLQNGTVISGTRIDKPHSFSTACNIATQIIAQVASSQYGGQSISLAHLAPFVDISRKKIIREMDLIAEKTGLHYSPEQFSEIVEMRLKDEITRGVQMIQYQVVTLMTTNGQSPFVTVFMYLNEVKDEQTKADLALIIEEVLRQRYQGVKNEAGYWVTPAFPKLIYVLEPDNITEDGKYFYLTELAAKCTARRLVPDYISEKKMKELKDGNCYPCMGCRSFLTVYHDPQTNSPKFYGRFNQGVVTINLVDVACSSGGNKDAFWKIFDERLQLCFRALMARHNRLLNTPSDVAPILWQNGALARLEKGEVINKLLYGGYSTISLGYAGLCECTRYMTGKPHTDPAATPFALEVMRYMNAKCSEWRDQTNIAFSLYGTPLESTTYKFAKCLKRRFGEIEGITDKNYITNSYHVHVTEPVDAFTKLSFESQFQELSPGGAVSYVEVPNMENNIPAVIALLKHIYENIMYAELNTKSDCCQKCGYTGEIRIVADSDGKLVWQCPNCGNTDQTKMNVARRTCGYIGTQYWNQGRTQEIKERVLHL
ncbi:anaerobic ribonucleoside-triphosphate reductase [Treponema berlinense]|uniref:anaerobic ribonucleoside-triphosphate reductase n=1 Tax=Treponema berlinense TaxID=225004 RepID=UPI0026EBB825|nr:anaerobic ribonucleoside-triphosphate reductase [Treponema berlinense]